MTAQELSEYLQNGELDFEFGYCGKSGTICFCHLPKVYIFYDEIETETTLEELMNTPVFNGKTLKEICNEMEFYG